MPSSGVWTAWRGPPLRICRTREGSNHTEAELRRELDRSLAAYPDLGDADRAAIARAMAPFRNQLIRCPQSSLRAAAADDPAAAPPCLTPSAATSGWPTPRTAAMRRWQGSGWPLLVGTPSPAGPEHRARRQSRYEPTFR